MHQRSVAIYESGIGSFGKTDRNDEKIVIERNWLNKNTSIAVQR